MSVKLKWSSLGQQWQDYIKLNLKFVSKNSFKFSKNQEPAIVYAYNLNEANDTVHVPYFFANQMFKRNINSALSYPKCNFTSTIQLYPDQEVIYQEALANLNEYGTTTLFVFTGMGKTRTAIEISVKLNHLILVMLTSVGIAKQWKESYEKLTNIKAWLVEQNKYPKTEIGAIICMEGRIDHIPPELLKQVGTLIIDEAHTFCTDNRIKKILKVQPRYIILATATLKRSDGLHKSLEAIAGEHHIYRKSIKPFEVYKYMTGISVPVKMTYFKKIDFNALLNDLCNHTERNRLILELILQNPDYKILVMTRRVEHVNFLYKILYENGQSVDYMCGTKKSYHDSRILIGTTQKIGTGFDEETACDDFQGFRINMLILVSTIKDESLLEQVAGRAFRSNFPCIIHLVDEPEILKGSHWNVADKWYRSRNGRIVERVSPLYVDMMKKGCLNPGSGSANSKTMADSLSIKQVIREDDLKYLV